MEQLEDCGPNDPAVLASFPAETSQYYPDGARAIIHFEQAPTEVDALPENALEANQKQHDKTWYLCVPQNGFQGVSVAVTHIWTEPPFHHSGRHKHLEAVVYALEGEGYSEMEGTNYYWEAGDVLHVPPAMMEHEHFNDSPNEIKQLRIQFGIRYWYTENIYTPYRSQRIYDEFGQPIVAGRIERHRER
jgi:quercetin dioxygenase-like cupin family protein